MKIISKTNEYLNLIQDSLRSGHLQIEKIYNRLKTCDPNKYVNIRTGYPVKYHGLDSDYVYCNGKYRLCWNSEAIEIEYNPIIIEKILSLYEKLLEDYSVNYDNNRIKELIDQEIIREGTQNTNYDNNNNDNRRSNNFSNRKRKIDDNLTLDNFLDISEEECEEQESENSFICGDDEILKSDSKKKKKSKRKLGKRVKYENINNLYKKELNTTPKRTLRKREKKINYIDDYELVYLDENMLIGVEKKEDNVDLEKKKNLSDDEDYDDNEEDKQNNK